jgi:hypothetical protein
MSSWSYDNTLVRGEGCGVGGEGRGVRAAPEQACLQGGTCRSTSQQPCVWITGTLPEYRTSFTSIYWHAPRLVTKRTRVKNITTDLRSLSIRHGTWATSTDISFLRTPPRTRPHSPPHHRRPLHHAASARLRPRGGNRRRAPRRD